MTLTHGALFAGVGGDTLGFDRADYRTSWLVEWDARCRSVLRRHWPEAKVYGDVRDVVGGLGRIPRLQLGRPVLRADGGAYGDEGSPDLLEPVDVITYGFPCQDLSVAGNRAGLDGDRSGLFFEAVRIIREMRDATDGRYPTWAVAENVPGLLSADDGHAMGRVLDELADVGALAIEWTVLDAQHFGVPQRRRRVFVVACFDPRAASADPLLPVAARCQGHPGPLGETGTGTSRVVAPRALGLSENQRGEVRLTEYSRQITTGGGKPGQGYPAVLIPAVKVIRSGARDEHGELPPEVWAEEDTAPTLNAFDNGSESRATVLAVSENQRGELRLTDYSRQITTGGGKPGQGYPAALTTEGVRRLTPRECERLQGWPDDHTRWDEHGNELPDSFRYRACGNGVAAPCAEWIARRLLEATP